MLPVKKYIFLTRNQLLPEAFDFEVKRNSGVVCVLAQVKGLMGNHSLCDKMSSQKKYCKESDFEQTCDVSQVGCSDDIVLATNISWLIFKIKCTG